MRLPPGVAFLTPLRIYFSRSYKQFKKIPLIEQENGANEILFFSGKNET